MSLKNYTLINANLMLADANISHGALIIKDGLIAKIIKGHMATDDYFGEIIDAKGKLVTPALIDCHTHVVYAGDRANEYEKRLKGVSYSDIAKAGGGIQSTVLATRNASFSKLYDESYPRLALMKSLGVKTIEIKSGYGLDLDSEIKMLKVAKQLGKDLDLRVKTTFLGAHALPKEYENQSLAYIDLVCQQMLPEIKAQNLADSVDVFCENIAFSLKETEKVFQHAKALGFDIKCHAEQLSNQKASALAASFDALSTDHLEYTDEKSIDAMAKKDVVAVLLPGAFYFLRETKKPNIDYFRQKAVKMAIATDANPGSSPTCSLPLMMNMATVLFNLTVKEAWLAVTKHASQALGLSDEIGEIAVGKKAELVQWDCDSLASMCYSFGQIKPISTFC